MSKCSLYNQGDLMAYPLLADCVIEDFTLTYLDVHNGSNSRFVTFWDPIIERVSQQLDR